MHIDEILASEEGTGRGFDPIPISNRPRWWKRRGLRGRFDDIYRRLLRLFGYI